jgi:hypothetical protein
VLNFALPSVGATERAPVEAAGCCADMPPSSAISVAVRLEELLHEGHGGVKRKTRARYVRRVSAVYV